MSPKKDSSPKFIQSATNNEKVVQIQTEEQVHINMSETSNIDIDIVLSLLNNLKEEANKLEKKPRITIIEYLDKIFKEFKKAKSNLLKIKSWLNKIILMVTSIKGGEGVKKLSENLLEMLSI